MFLHLLQEENFAQNFTQKSNCFKTVKLFFSHTRVYFYIREVFFAVYNLMLSARSASASIAPKLISFCVIVLVNNIIDLSVVLSIKPSDSF